MYQTAGCRLLFFVPYGSPLPVVPHLLYRYNSYMTYSILRLYFASLIFARTKASSSPVNRPLFTGNNFFRFFQKIFSVHTHKQKYFFSFSFSQIFTAIFYISALSSGILIQRGPPRPLDSSELAISSTSIPC